MSWPGQFSFYTPPNAKSILVYGGQPTGGGGGDIYGFSLLMWEVRCVSPMLS